MVLKKGASPLFSLEQPEDNEEDDDFEADDAL